MFRFTLPALGTICLLACFQKVDIYPSVHLGLSIRDCREAGTLKLCIDKNDTDAETIPHIDSTFILEASGSLKIGGKDTLVSGYRFPFNYRGLPTQVWELPDSVELGKSAIEFRACVKDVSNFLNCDTAFISL